MKKGLPIYEVSAKEVSKVKRRSIPFILLFSLLIALWTIFWVMWRFPFQNSIVMGIGVLGYVLIIVDYLKKNQFGIYEAGISPPSKPMSMILRKDVFIPYADISEMDLETAVDRALDMDVFDPYSYFTLTLRTGKKIKISITGWFGALHRYVKSDREMKRVYSILIGVMKELGKEENLRKREKGEFLVIDKSVFNNM